MCWKPAVAAWRRCADENQKRQGSRQQGHVQSGYAMIAQRLASTIVGLADHRILIDSHQSGSNGLEISDTVRCNALCLDQFTTLDCSFSPISDCDHERLS